MRNIEHTCDAIVAKHDHIHKSHSNETDPLIRLTNGMKWATVCHRPKVEGKKRNEQLLPLPHANLPEEDGNRNLAKAVDDPKCNGVGIFAQHAANGYVNNDNLRGNILEEAIEVPIWLLHLDIARLDQHRRFFGSSGTIIIGIGRCCSHVLLADHLSCHDYGSSYSKSTQYINVRQCNACLASRAVASLRLGLGSYLLIFAYRYLLFYPLGPFI